jgi:transcriptional regulator with XRE-family HTH domain
MAKQGGKTKIQNRLWRARKRCGLGQKQVAFLIGKTIDEVSRYERGARIPELRTIIALEIVYGTPLRILFKDLYGQILTEIRTRIDSRASLKELYAEFLENDTGLGEYCSYEGLLRAADLSDAERGKARDHVTRLAKKIAGL